MGNSIGSTLGRIPSIYSPDRYVHPRRADVSRLRAVLGRHTGQPPARALPFTGKVASEGEIAYAHFAERNLHVVLSKTLDKVTWKNTRIVRDIEEIQRMKQQAGKDMHAVGGATLVGSLMNQRLIDELRLVVYPIVLGGGKALFKDVRERHALKFLGAKPLESGLVRLTYST